MFEKINERVKKLDVWDISLTKMSVLVATIIIVKLFPQLLNISYLALIVIVILLAARPMWSFWFKK